MKWVVAAFLFLGAIVQASGQQSLGLSQSEAPGPIVKLEGFVVHPVPGGYLAISVPAKDLRRLLTMAEMLSGTGGLAVVERLEKESTSLVATAGSSSVPLGICFLSTSEIYTRHKILDRKVQMVGTYTFLNVHGKVIRVRAYSGGPGRKSVSEGS